MKYLSIILVVLTLSSCQSIQKKSKEVDSSEVLNQTVDGDDGIILLGKIDRKGLEKDEFRTWFAPNYDNYTPNPAIISDLKPLVNDVDIVVFMGTWCEDSHRDVPDFFRILDALDYDASKVTMYAVSDDKSQPEELIKEYKVIQVPTFIFYRNGEEINRIVEYSIRTLEQDMLDILSGKKYKNPYADF